MTDSGPSDTAADHDVVVVGGGPAGCSAGVFTARYGLDTVVFDKGSSALRRCAYLENYLGFPAGVDVEVFHDLMHAHVREAGGALVTEAVESVERGPSGSTFPVETGADRTVTADHVIAASWYDASYLRGLEEPEMFSAQEHHGEVAERFDPEYPDADGRTPIDGLYVASPAGERSEQTIVAAGQGAHVARALIADRRRARGYSGGVRPHYDWLRPEAEFAGEWADRDRWREWFDNEFGDEDAGPDQAEHVDGTAEETGIDEDRLADLREAYIDRAFETRRTEAEIERAAEDGLERLITVIGTDRVLDAIDDAAIRAYVTAPDEATHE